MLGKLPVWRPLEFNDIVSTDRLLVFCLRLLAPHISIAGWLYMSCIWLTYPRGAMVHGAWSRAQLVHELGYLSIASQRTLRSLHATQAKLALFLFCNTESSSRSPEERCSPITKIIRWWYHSGRIVNFVLSSCSQWTKSSVTKGWWGWWEFGAMREEGVHNASRELQWIEMLQQFEPHVVLAKAKYLVGRLLTLQASSLHRLKLAPGAWIFHFSKIIDYRLLYFLVVEA